MIRKPKIKKQQQVLRTGRLPVKVIVLATVFILSGALLGAGLYYIVKADFMKIKNLTVEGNYHLTGAMIMNLLNVQGKSMLSVDSTYLSGRLMKSPWISEALLRKEFPDRLVVRIKEKEPVAVTLSGEAMYLVDEHGGKLEKVDRMPLLPLIAIKSDNAEAYGEAIKLSQAINANRDLRGVPVQITGTKSEDLAMEVDKTLVLIGTGSYDKKITSYLSLKDDIQKRNIPVEYVDVRFTHRLIVKSVKAEEK